MEFTSIKTNKKIVINEASFKTASKMLRFTLKKIKENNKLGDLFSQDISANSFKDINVDELKNNIDLSAIIEFVSDFASDEELENIIFEALDRSIYGNERITISLFDTNPEYRQDYFIICFNALKVNLMPFFASLSSR